MKKIFFVITGLLSSYLLIGQSITITGNDMPKAGRVNVVAYDTTTNIGLGSASANSQTWDFTALHNHYSKVASYSPMAPYQQYAPSFSGSNLYTYGPSYMFTSLFGGAPVDQSAWGYMFWGSDATGLRIVGFRGNYGLGDKNILESSQEYIMKTPATYGSTFSNNSQWSVIYNANPGNYDTNYVCKVNKTLSVDAWGQITTTFGTFSVVRVHENLVKTDTVYPTLNGIPVYPGYVLRRQKLNNYYFWAKNVGYPVAIVHCDSINGVKDIEYLKDTVASFSITGVVHTDNGTTPVTSGTARLIARDSVDNLFGVHELVNVDANGHFQFSNVVEGGNWLVLATPDTSVYPDFMPTYYGNHIFWQDASVLHPVSDTGIAITAYYNANLNVSNPNDPGQMSGTVYSDFGAKAITPAKDITITLVDATNGSIQRYKKTDHLGTYHFKNLQNNSYRLIVDIAGDQMDSTYTVTVNNSTHSNLDFVFDSTLIYLHNPNSVSVISTKNKELGIYPNPISDNAVIIVNTEEKMFSYNFFLFDVLGKMVKEFSGNSNGTININRDGLMKGFYFYNLQINNVSGGSGKIVVN